MKARHFAGVYGRQGGRWRCRSGNDRGGRRYDGDRLGLVRSDGRDHRRRLRLRRFDGDGCGRSRLPRLGGCRGSRRLLRSRSLRRCPCRWLRRFGGEGRSRSCRFARLGSLRLRRSCRVGRLGLRRRRYGRAQIRPIQQLAAHRAEDQLEMAAFVVIGLGQVGPSVSVRLPRQAETVVRGRTADRRSRHVGRAGTLLEFDRISAASSSVHGRAIEPVAAERIKDLRRSHARHERAKGENERGLQGETSPPSTSPMRNHHSCSPGRSRVEWARNSGPNGAKTGSQ